MNHQVHHTTITTITILLMQNASFQQYLHTSTYRDTHYSILPSDTATALLTGPQDDEGKGCCIQLYMYAADFRARIDLCAL